MKFLRIVTIAVFSVVLAAGVNAQQTASAGTAKTAAKKTTAKKTTAKKTTAKKTTAKKTTAKKTTAKKTTKKTTKKKVAKKSKSKTKKVCSTVKGKKRCRYIKEFQGHGVATASLRTEPLPKPSGDVWLYAENFREEVKVNIYGPSGQLNDEALAALDHEFRCRRSGEERAVDTRLVEVLSIIQDHFGGKRVELVSGFRFVERDSSRHHHAAAMDIRIPGVSAKELYAFAESLDMGGMGIGIYPNTGFVHVDYRAPGEPSYRWTDYSGSNTKSKNKSKRPGKKKKPTS